MQVLLANPRGFCAGVDRAIEIVERAIETLGAPIYVYALIESALRGEVRVIFFDEGGRAERHIDFAPLGGGKPAYYRLSSAPWHTMTALSPVAVVHEILEGPFMASQDPPPPWMPQSEEALREFVQKAGQPQAA